MEKNNIKLVIFDFDGTICDTMPVCFEAFRRTIHSFTSRTLTDEEIVATFGPSEEGSLRILLPEVELGESLPVYLDNYKELHATCEEPFEGIVGIIERLRRAGIRTALVTGKGAGSCRISLDYYGLHELFDVVLAGSAVGDIKPENISEVLRRLSVPNTDAIYVGDSPSDVASSRKAGIKVVSVLWGAGTQEDKVKAEGPDAIFHKVGEFGEYIFSRI